MSEFEISAFAPARRPFRDLLAALGLSRRGNPRGVDVLGIGLWPDAGTVTGTARQPGTSCRDRVRLVSGAIAFRIGSKKRIEAAYAPLSEALDPLRTRCPGPVLGSRLAAATDFLSARTLGHRRLALALTRSTAFVDHGYRVRVKPEISLILLRTGVLRSTVSGVAFVTSSGSALTRGLRAWRSDRRRGVPAEARLALSMRSQ
jgi:hypothetical protein